MPSDSFTEHVIQNIFLGHVPNFTMLHILGHSLLLLSDQCCVAKPVSTTHVEWPTQALILESRRGVTDWIRIKQNKYIKEGTW